MNSAAGKPPSVPPTAITPNAVIALGLGSYQTSAIFPAPSATAIQPALIAHLWDQVKSIMERLPVRSANLGTGENWLWHPDFKAILRLPEEHDLSN